MRSLLLATPLVALGAFFVAAAVLESQLCANGGECDEIIFVFSLAIAAIASVTWMAIACVVGWRRRR